MRKILFRGKADTNRSDGKWHYGVPILYKPTSKAYIPQWQIYTKDKEKIPVFSDTIGQYTGLTDSNGTKIFEGDILKRTLKGYYPEISYIFKIAYDPTKATFAVVDTDGSCVNFISDYINKGYEIEVIGNIYDNPELLEVENEQIHRR